MVLVENVINIEIDKENTPTFMVFEIKGKKIILKSGRVPDPLDGITFGDHSIDIKLTDSDGNTKVDILKFTIMDKV